MAEVPWTSTVSDLRRRNRARTLWHLYLHGPSNRNEIGLALAVSAATVTNVVSELLADGVLVESGNEPSTGGRRSARLRIDPDVGHVVGVDVGESSVLVELFDLGMGVRATQRLPVDLATQAPGEVVDRVLLGVQTVLDRSGVPEAGVLGVGIGVPGLIDHSREAVVHGQSVGWDAVPIEALLRAHTAMPLAVDNGAKLLGQAEHWFGAARGAADVIIVLIGQGVGTSILTSRTTDRGPMAGAGEWGHTVVEVDGRRCRCGALGCLEAYVGAAALLVRYDELSGRPSGGTGSEGLEARAADLVRRADHDPVAARVVAEALRYLGAGIGNLVNLFGPRRVVIGGWLGRELAQRHLPGLRSATERNALRLPFRDVELMRADLGVDAVALGAATLPVAAFLSSGGRLEDRVRGRRI